LKVEIKPLRETLAKLKVKEEYCKSMMEETDALLKEQ
jgi:hypothetical protein